MSLNNYLIGIAATTGKVQGRVTVISPNNLEYLLADPSRIDILVSKNPFPSLILVLKYARGLITESGGITSHAAIIAREVGIPCVVGVTTGIIKLLDGMPVLLDAEQGKVWYEA